MAIPVPADDLPDGVVCVLGVAGSIGARERQHIAWFAEFLGADKAATTPEQHARALAAYQAHYDDAAPTETEA